MGGLVCTKLTEMASACMCSCQKLARPRKQMSAADLPPRTGSETTVETDVPSITITNSRCRPGILGVCEKQVLFRGMETSTLRCLAGRCKEKRMKEGKCIMTQGEPVGPHSELNIVLTGAVRLSASGTDPLDTKVFAGHMFGEAALLYGSTRTASAHSLGCTVASLTLTNLQTFLSAMPHARLLMFLRKQMLLSSLTDFQLSKLAQNVECRDYATGTSLLTQGSPGHEMFFVRKGHVSVVVDGVQKAVEGRGHVLGQRALHGKPRTATCRAEDDVVVVVVRDSVLDSIQDPVLQRILACDAVMAIQQHTRVFGSFTEDQMTDLLRSLEENAFTSTVITKGQPMHELFIVRDGRVGGSAVSEAGGFQYFGSFTGQPCISDVYVETGLATIIKCSRQRWLDVFKQRRPTQPLNLDVLIWKGELGSGESGKVCLAQLKHDPANLVAVKMVAKASKSFLNGHALAESMLMQSLSHPFCVRLFNVAEDQTYFYLVMEYVPGGELFNQLVVQEKLSETTTKFYVACVILALEYLHRNGIVYRDLKPENLLLDARGYVKVTDFGYSKRIGTRRTYTMCGTPEYQAPEIMTVDMGATTAADYWSLGVLVYELLTGASPFVPRGVRSDQKLSDPWVIIRNARSGRYPPPRGYEGSLVHNLIDRLLQVNPGDRLCDIGDLKNHEWFRGFDWQALLEGRLHSPSQNMKGGWFSRQAS